MFINDITSCFHNSNALLFADDLKLYRTVNCEDDAAELQSDICRLATWCLTNGMDLNINKCHIIRFTRSHQPVIFDYTINGQPLDAVDRVKDLGVILDDSLTFTYHITSIVNRSTKMLGFIKRTTRDFTSLSAIKILYCTLVRTHLDYCSSVWSPHYGTHISKIDRVQKSFLRYVSFKSNIFSDYASIESYLNIPTLENRRSQRDLLTLYKILNGEYDCPDLLSQISLIVPTRRTRQIATFHTPYHRTNIAYFSYIPRSLRAANCLDIDIFSTPLPKFKNQLCQ